MVAAVGWDVYQREHAEACARLACDETGMGVYEDKVLKHRKKTLGTLRDLQVRRRVGLIEEDRSRGLLKFAKPVGVVGALTPVTNASSTHLLQRACPSSRTRNAVIFAPHPSAKRTAALTCEYMRAALRKVGAPEDLVQHIAEPSIPLTQELMQGGGPHRRHGRRGHGEGGLLERDPRLRCRGRQFDLHRRRDRGPRRCRPQDRPEQDLRQCHLLLQRELRRHPRDDCRGDVDALCGRRRIPVQPAGAGSVSSASCGPTGRTSTKQVPGQPATEDRGCGRAFRSRRHPLPSGAGRGYRTAGSVLGGKALPGLDPLDVSGVSRSDRLRPETHRL